LLGASTSSDAVHGLTMDLLSVPYVGSWVPSEVVEVVTRFARRLNKEVAWGDIQQLLVLIHQVK